MESGVWPGVDRTSSGRPPRCTSSTKGSKWISAGAPLKVCPLPAPPRGPFRFSVPPMGFPFPAPGHTPDSISLLDRANGLLFTGDTYYPAPIWLFRPETDLDAYVNSVKRLAALVPNLKLVLGAHNIPAAEPSVLSRLVTAIQAVRSGQGTVKAAR